MERFSKKQLVDAGKAISAFNPTHTPELIQAFGVAHAWRYGHLAPMRRVRQELSAKAASVSQRTAVTAGRLKRFQSIRRKLKSGRVTLYQMQDIAGVRAIMHTSDQVARLAEAYDAGSSRYAVIDRDDYLQTPKRDGYRSKHLVLKFDSPDGVAGGNRITVELQIRTRLQHAWATAVEAVGLVRNENLKAGQGSPDWLRFFALASGEFAAEECLPMVPGVPDDASARLDEIRDIADRLDAIATLESYNQAIHQTAGYLGLKGHSYLVQYNAETKQVSVQTYSSFAMLSQQAFDEEVFNNQPNTIVVEIDKVDDLRAAYPNYFLDVRMFTDRMKRVILSSGAPGVSRVRPVSKWAPFLEFLTDRGRRD